MGHPSHVLVASDRRVCIHGVLLARDGYFHFRTLCPIQSSLVQSSLVLSVRGGDGRNLDWKEEERRRKKAEQKDAKLLFCSLLLDAFSIRGNGKMWPDADRQTRCRTGARPLSLTLSIFSPFSSHSHFSLSVVPLSITLVSLLSHSSLSLSSSLDRNHGKRSPEADVAQLGS